MRKPLFPTQVCIESFEQHWLVWIDLITAYACFTTTTDACIIQSLWCVAFSRESLLISAILLSSIAYFLCVATDLFAVTDASSMERPSLLIQAAVVYPIRIHFAWTTAAAIVNWNLWIVSLKNQQIEVFFALLSLWAAAAIGSYR
jgi:hypothetical protein